MVNQPETIELSDIYTMSALDLMHHFGVNYQIAQTLVEGLADAKILAAELSLIEKHGIEWATVLCPEYPNILKTIYMLPPVIYWRGSMLKQDEKSIAFVGARAANRYCQQAIDILVPPLIDHGYTIISGGAKGADGMAHQAAVDKKGKTIAVLGAGLLAPYAPGNRTLFKEVLEHDGAIMSTFSLLTDPLPPHFPIRNRIIAGLSRGTVVVQAAQKSGALITARFALDQGRDVFAIPGSMFDPLSEGCHNLIAQGAKLVGNATDILKEYGEIEPEEVPAKTKKKSDETEDQMAITYDDGAIKPAIKTHASMVDLNDTSPGGRVMIACIEPKSMDELVLTTGFDDGMLQGLLFDLQLEGRIKQNFMGMWETV